MAASRAAASSAPSGVLARFREWLLRFRAIERARAREEPWRREHVRHARAAVDLAESTHEPTLADGEAYASAARELYRRAALHALLALADEPRTGASASDALHGVASELVLEAAGSAEELAEIERLLATPSLADLAALPSDDSSRATEKLDRFAHSLLRTLEHTRPDPSTLRFERALRVAALLAIVVTVSVVAIARWQRFREKTSDLLRGKPWRISSEAWPCDRKERACGNFRELDIFFHTREEPSPWIEFDLGQEATFSRVSVRNRSDCCPERAVPLVIEVSSDRQHWREVMRQPRTFSLWNAKFSPARARWVRLRVPRTSSLHLGDVKVLP